MVTIEDQIACVKRELAMRRKVYPKRIQAGLMDPDFANREVLRMDAVLQTLEKLNPPKQLPLCYPPNGDHS